MTAENTTLEVSAPEEHLRTMNTVGSLINHGLNGMTIGTFFPIAYQHIKNQHSSKNILMFGAAGCLVGVVFGLYEAERINTYRKAVSDNIKSLAGRLDALEASKSPSPDTATIAR